MESSGAARGGWRPRGGANSNNRGGRGTGRGGRGGHGPAPKRARTEGDSEAAPETVGETGEAGAPELHDNRTRPPLPPPARSARFDAYYTAQKLTHTAAEFDELAEALLRPLPVTFRVNPLDPSAPALLRHLSVELPALAAAGKLVLEDGTPVPPPMRLPWYPHGLAWTATLGRKELRKAAPGGGVKALHEWLVAANAAGAISRQEAVSMIPPLLLAVAPHHAVLDMCASPGSKTAQLLEALHTGELDPAILARLDVAAGLTTASVAADGSSSAGAAGTGAGAGGEVDWVGLDGHPAASGFVVANDNEPRRAYLLTHQTGRLGSSGIIVTCHDAQEFPRIGAFAPPGSRGASSAAAAAASSPAGAGAAGAEASGVASGTLAHAPPFDRVLCDVPCSGDGTARKNVDVLPKWSPASGALLHPLQVQIGMRGLQLLKPGGYMAYSTCSFNPTENEAVVAELLRRCGGAVELVDCADRLPGLIRSPGMSDWLPFDAGMNPYAAFADTAAADAAARAALAKSKWSGKGQGREGGAAAAASAGASSSASDAPASAEGEAASAAAPAAAAMEADAAAPAAADGAAASSAADGNAKTRNPRGAMDAIARLTPSMWPPGPKQAANAAEVATQARGAGGEEPRALHSALRPSEYHLERCLRLLPHAQDSGGFFVALLRKTRELPRAAGTTKPTRFNFARTGPFGAAGAAAAAAGGADAAAVDDEVAAGGAGAGADAAPAVGEKRARDADDADAAGNASDGEGEDKADGEDDADAAAAAAAAAAASEGGDGDDDADAGAGAGASSSSSSSAAAAPAPSAAATAAGPPAAGGWRAQLQAQKAKARTDAAAKKRDNKVVSRYGGTGTGEEEAGALADSLDAGSSAGANSLGIYFPIAPAARTAPSSAVGFAAAPAAASAAAGSSASASASDAAASAQPLTGLAANAVAAATSPIAGPLLRFYGMDIAPAPPAGFEGLEVQAPGSAVVPVAADAPGTAWARAATQLATAHGSMPLNSLWFRGDNGRNIVIVNGAVAENVVVRARTTGVFGGRDGPSAGAVAGPKGTVRVVATGLKLFEAGGDAFAAAFGGDSARRVALGMATGPAAGKGVVPASAAAAGAPAAPSASSAAASAGGASSGSTVGDGTIRGIMNGHGSATPYRLSLEGAMFAAPFMCQQVVYASGAEMAAVLRQRGSHTGSAGLPKRFVAALNRMTVGGAVLVLLAPALDGCENAAEVYPAHTPEGAAPAGLGLTRYAGGDGAAAFHRVFAVEGERMRVRPRAAVPAADAAAIPPPFRAHYTRRAEMVLAGAGAAAPGSAAAAAEASAIEALSSAAPASGAAGDWLHWRPHPSRLFRGATPLSTVSACLWVSRGSGKLGVMVTEEETARMLSALAAAGYA